MQRWPSLICTLTAAPAFAVTAASTYDTLAYTYDASARSSTPHVTTAGSAEFAGDAGVASWVVHVSETRLGVATNTAVRAPQVIRAGELNLPGVPRGATGVPVRSGNGLEYPIPRGTPELDPRVASIRVMDPVTSGKYQYPNGYVSYMNSGGQVVSPLTGQALQPSDPLWHIPLS